MRRYRQLQAQLADAKRLYAAAQVAAKKEDQARMAESVEKLGNRVSAFSVNLETAADLVFEIAHLASETGVGSFAMKPKNRQGLSTVPDCDRIGEKRIDVSFTSRFHGFAALLNALERHCPVLFVESFAIRYPRVQTSDPQVDMELAVLVEKPYGS